MSLPTTIKAIQRSVGATADGIFGPETAALVWRALNDPDDETQAIPGGDDMDARTVNYLMTLDPKAREPFGQFYRLANATAATLAALTSSSAATGLGKSRTRSMPTGGPRQATR